jgi:hypothetical protein
MQQFRIFAHVFVDQVTALLARKSRVPPLPKLRPLKMDILQMLLDERQGDR